ncbi:MAG: tRNA (N6-isopentenyl adenosine(37)-C2)-methylthiotransferase MiaB [Clostridiales bacterium]|nr:tRNA (N6-isopentenyl adenosine(37)-C2)-methylthiotransferase MiaB [Clostridiales bacterium]
MRYSIIRREELDFSVIKESVGAVPFDEIKKQREYTLLVRTVVDSRFKNSPKAYVHTYGCQGNVADGERIKGMLREMGFVFTDSPKDADLVLYNTCAVREHAEDRVFGNVGALKPIKEINRDLKIVLCGCMMQQKKVADKIRMSYSFVDIVFGTHVMHRFPEFMYRMYCTGKKVFEIGDSAGVIAEGLPVSRDSSFKAWVPIMYGCNNFCSYCIVPYVRGRERSRSSKDVLDEVKEVIKSGYKEITLLGQNVNSYGKADGEMDFASLLREINDLDGDFMIRFMTSHPKDCTRELIDTMAECKKVAKHLHLPVQSGNDRILQEMNRHYTREKYLDLVRYAREKMPSLSITSDIIVGFPGETDSEFDDTLSLVDEVKYTSLFMFIFSPRDGTAAAKMDDPVSHAEKVKRFKKLEELQAKNSIEIASSMKDKVYRILCDTDCGKGLLSGKTEGNMTVTFEGDPDNVGKFLNILITESNSWNLKGKII